MKARKYILEKQIQWAKNRAIKLIGSKGNRGQRVYTSKLRQNLFEPLSTDVLKSFEKGDGNEINGSLNSPAKMQALHSSSALGVNIFHYWQRVKQVPLIAAACGFCNKGNNTSQRIVFEDKYSIDKRFQFSPNIDVVIHNSDTAKVKRFAVECKFSEAYAGRKHGGLDPKYIKLDILWKDIPGILSFAETISPDDNEFRYLHPAQLVKHILGLKNRIRERRL